MLTRKKETERSTRPRSKLKESETRRREKSSDSESYRRRLLTDRLRLMLSEPRELLRRARDRPESVKDSSIRRDSA